MHIEIDKYASLKSPIHNWDPRFKIITLLCVIFATPLIKTPKSAVAGFLFSIILYIFSRIPIHYIYKKIFYPLVFLVPLFLVLPFTSGGTAFYETPYFNVYLEGILLSFQILLRTTMIIIIFFTMMGTSYFSDTSAALGALKIPDKLLYMILFTYRYIFIFLEDQRKMKSALNLRGFRNKNSLRSFRSSAHLAGSLLIRSYEKTDEIYNAMVTRGFTGETQTLYEYSMGAKDIIKSCLVLTVITIIIIIPEIL